VKRRRRGMFENIFRLEMDLEFKGVFHFYKYEGIYTYSMS
jgi:hypothetical protein